MRVLSDPVLQDEFRNKGYVKVPFFLEEEVAAIVKFYHKNEGAVGEGYHSTLFSGDASYRKKVHEYLKSAIEKGVQKYFAGYKVVIATFLIKEPGELSNVGLHCDWALTDESKYPSIILWVSLQDITEKEGAMYMLDGSNKFTNTLRGNGIPVPYDQIPDDFVRSKMNLVETRTGDAVIFDLSVLHCSFPNFSDSPRLAFNVGLIPEEAPMLHYYRNEETGEDQYDLYEVDQDFFTSYDMTKKPENVRYIGRKEYRFDGLTPRELMRIYGYEPEGAPQHRKIGAYYDERMDAYDASYGDIIQAFRPSNDDELIDYIIKSASLEDGQVILDAGCGVGGPAIRICERLNVKIIGITISEKQAEAARKAVREKGLEDRIEVIHGDYHDLESHFSNGQFDRVLFLESLGHSDDPEHAISQAHRVLKRNGKLYIKDFYIRETDDEALKRRIDKAIANINESYSYNTMELHRIITALRKSDVALEFIKRFDFSDDLTVRSDFENKQSIDLYDGQPEFMPADWLEILVEKL